MRQIFLSPRSNETAYDNFKSSLLNGVPLSRIEKHLSPVEKQLLKDQEPLFIWGCQPSLKDKWDRIRIGDYVLFYEKGIYLMAAEISFKKFSPEIALELWPKSEDTGEPWSGIYIVNNLRSIHLPIEEFNKIAGYSMDSLRGFQRVAEDHMDKILKVYGSPEQFIDAISGLKNYQVGILTEVASKAMEVPSGEDIDKIDSIFGDSDPDDVIAELSARNTNKTPSERSRMVNVITRDYKQAKALKEKYQNRCQIEGCGFTFKTKRGTYYSEAAHIKAISTREVGVDTAENILILCPNHHKMLDLGAMEMISNDEVKIDGKVLKINR